MTNTVKTSRLAATTEQNLQAIASGLNRIRCLVEEARRQGDGRPVEEVLTEIYVVADRLHNVPGFLAAGTPCNAMSLLNGGPWPMGVDGMEWVDHYQKKPASAALAS